MLSERLRRWKKNLSARMSPEYVLTLRSDINRFADMAQSLESENTKLRELAKYAIYCAEGDLRCEGCPLRDNSNTEHVICGMHRIAHELGIEVDR